MAMTASPMFNPGLLLALPAGQGTSTPGASSSKLRIARNPTTRIRQAVRDNNVTLLQRLAHQDLRNTDRNRLTSLSWAAVDGSLEVFEWLLLDYGHDDQELSRDSDNNTLLHLLASIPISPSPSSVPYSVPSTPAFPPLPPLAPHTRSRISQSMLGLYHAIFPFLLDWSNSGGKTALHVASQAGNADLVSLLLERGADAELTDLQGNTPLHYAAAWGHEEAAEVLMREGEAMWSTRNAEGFTPGDYAWNQAARQRLGVVWEDEVKRRKAQREEEEREREREEREEREYQQEMRRMYDHQAMDQEKGFDLSPTDTRGSAGEAHDTHRRRPSRQFDPSSLPYQARSSAPSHAHWQSRVPLPARADSLQSVQPSPQGRAGPQYSIEDRDRQSEWLDSPDLSPSPIPQRPGLIQRDSHSSGPSFSGYATPRWDVSPGPGSAPGVAVGRAEENPISAHLARMAPPSAPSRNRPTMHHRRSSSMAQALGPGVTLAPPLPHIAIEHQASGQAPLPSLRYAEEEEDEGDEAVLNDKEDLESPLSYLGVPGQSQKGLSHEAAQQQQQIEAGMGRMSVQGAGSGQGQGQRQGHGQGDWPGQQAMASSSAKLGSTPARGTAAGPPVW